MRVHLRAGASALVGALAAAALAGCGSGGGGGAAPTLTPPPLGAALAPPSGREGMLGLPLSAFGLGDEAAAVRLAAMRAVVAGCMRAAGYAEFSREDAVAEGVRPGDAGALPAGAFGYLPESVAAVQGFHAPAVPAAAAPRRAVTGAEEGALQECVKSSHARLVPPDAGGSELVNRLFGESQAALERDPRVGAAVRSWADCMDRAGFPGVTPAGLVDRYRAKAAATPAPTQEELAAARADAACTTTANLAGIWFTVLAGYQRQLIAAHQEELAAYRDSHREYQAKLAELAAGP